MTLHRWKKPELDLGHPEYTWTLPIVDKEQLCNLFALKKPTDRKHVGLGRMFRQREAKAFRNLFCPFYDICLSEAILHQEHSPESKPYKRIADFQTWICHPTCPHREEAVEPYKKLIEDCSGPTSIDFSSVYSFTTSKLVRMLTKEKKHG
jgi:hypothetical protein